MQTCLLARLPACRTPAPAYIHTHKHMVAACLSPTAVQVFELFDIKQNHVIEFGEFVRSLSVFHPKAPLPEKAKCEQHAQWGGPGWRGWAAAGGRALLRISAACAPRVCCCCAVC